MRRSRSAVERVIRSRRLSRFAHNSSPVRELALAYFAGEEIDDAIDVGSDFAHKGLGVSFTHLSGRDDESDSVPALVELLERLDDASDVELSIHPSALGLRESLDDAVARLADLSAAAEERGAHVTLGMQGHTDYRATLDLFRAGRESHEALGLTLPVDIRRAERDCRALAADGARVRVCIGSHRAPAQVAIWDEHEKSLALVRCMRILFEGGGHPMVASHDPRIIAIAQELAAANDRDADGYEFQMMMGVRPLEQRRLVDIGLRSRTSIPFGPNWYEYFASRMATRPQTLWSYARAVLDKR